MSEAVDGTFLSRDVSVVMTSDPIITDRLILRPPEPGDAGPVFRSWASDPEVVKYLTWYPHASPLETENWIQESVAGWKEGTDFPYLIARKTGEVIGGMAWRPESAKFKGSIGYVLARSEWGQGLMTEALKALLENIFSDPAVFRAYAYCHVANRASMRVMEKAGMAREGLLRRLIVFPNLSPQPLDVYCYARTRQE